eukprot:800311_1
MKPRLNQPGKKRRRKAKVSNPFDAQPPSPAPEEKNNAPLSCPRPFELSMDIFDDSDENFEDPPPITSSSSIIPTQPSSHTPEPTTSSHPSASSSPPPIISKSHSSSVTQPSSSAIFSKSSGSSQLSSLADHSPVSKRKFTPTVKPKKKAKAPQSKPKSKAPSRAKPKVKPKVKPKTNPKSKVKPKPKAKPRSKLKPKPKPRPRKRKRTNADLDSDGVDGKEEKEEEEVPFAKRTLLQIMSDRKGGKKSKSELSRQRKMREARKQKRNRAEADAAVGTEAVADQNAENVMKAESLEKTEADEDEGVAMAAVKVQVPPPNPNPLLSIQTVASLPVPQLFIPSQSSAPSQSPEPSQSSAAPSQSVEAGILSDSFEDDGLGLSLDFGDDLFAELSGGVDGASQTAGPQMKLVDGEMVIDDSSLMIQNPTSLLTSSDYTRVTESGARAIVKTKRTHTERWQKEETDKFYKYLSTYGPDFTFMQRAFPSRTRKQLKNKFKKEEKSNPERIDEALSSRSAVDEDEFSELLNPSEEKTEGKTDEPQQSQPNIESVET